jgi:hypothetical protein
MIHEQQDLRDRTFRQGQDQRRRGVRRPPMHAPSGTEEHRFKIAAAGTATLRGVGDLVITAIDALALAPEKFRTEADTYLGLRSIFWSLVRAKTDDDLRDVASRLWSMAATPDMNGGDMNDLGRAGEAMGEAESSLGEGNATAPSARKGARSMPCARTRRVWRNRCSSRWDKVAVPAAAAGSASRARSRTPIRLAVRCAGANTATTTR